MRSASTDQPHAPKQRTPLPVGVVQLVMFGLIMGAFCVPAAMLTAAKLGIPASFRPVWVVLFVIVGGTGFGLLARFAAWFADRTGSFLLVSGASTPSKPSYSYEQSLVMRGRPDDAIESLLAHIAAGDARDDKNDARLRLAELYLSARQDATRAAELFREVQRDPRATAANDVYVTNRLVDLLIGPLNDPGRAAVELRSLIERRPNTRAAAAARTALSGIRARLFEAERNSAKSDSG